MPSKLPLNIYLHEPWWTGHPTLFLPHIHAINSEWRWRPCLAIESATKLEFRPLWIIETSRPPFRAFRMKFRWKFKFHGPPSSLLHHWTAFAESDSIVSFAVFKASHDRVIFTARCIASISALLISMKGIGEKINTWNSRCDFARLHLLPHVRSEDSWRHPRSIWLCVMAEDSMTLLWVMGD